MARRNLIAAIVLIALGVGYGVLTANLPTRAFENTTEPSFFPWVVTVCLLTLAVAMLIQAVSGKPGPAGEYRIAFGPGVGPGKYVAGLAAFVIYLGLLPVLGFLAANVLFFAVLMVIYDERRPWVVAAGAVGVSVVLFFLFRQMFQIRLPAGILDIWIP